METRIMLASEIKEIPAAPEGAPVCWRCKGTGIVDVSHGMVGTGKTPCGACLGTKIPPKPCPKCKSVQVKCASDFMHFFWRCRDCGHMGPASRSDVGAMKLWNEEGE